MTLDEATLLKWCELIDAGQSEKRDVYDFADDRHHRRHLDEGAKKDIDDGRCERKRRPDCDTVFTQQMGHWWLKSHTLNQSAPQKDVIIEPQSGGRWYEMAMDGSQCQWGHVIEWDPPRRVLLAWQLTADWKFDPTLTTEVEVRFTPEGEYRTRVDLEHRLLDRFGPRAEAVRQSLDSPGGWLGLLEAYAHAM